MTSHEPDVGVCLLAHDGTVLFRDEAFARIVRHEVPVGGDLGDVSDALSGLPTDRPVERSLDEVELTVTPTRLDGAAAIVRARRRGSREALERDLRIARRTLESILDAAPVTILALDTEQRVTMWNATAARMFGWTAEEIVGRPYPLVPEGQEASFAKLFAQVIGGQGFTNVEATRQTKDGRSIELRVHTAPLRDADGRVTGAMAILEDLTEQRRLEEQIRHAQKMEAVGRLAGGIAHDFNNLLSVILGVCEMLSRDRSLPPRVLDGLAQIAGCGDSARRLTQQLLAFSRRQVLHPEVADVSARVRQTSGMLRRLIGEPIEMQLDLDEAALPVEVDLGQFDQMLVNLVVNARDAMGEGGHLCVRTRLDEVGVGGPVPPGRYARLEVSDDGRGIPAEILSQVFDPFFTTKAPGQGTGLGLSTVHGIVEQSGGTIRVESTPGEGTTFRIWLPLTDEPASEPAEPRAADPAAGGEPILLVEDDPQVRRVLARVLGALGYPVETAADGQQALEMLERGVRAELVITDLAMPRMGGRALAERVRELRPGVPIVYISANLDDPAVRAEVDAGRAAFLQKPVSMAALGRTLRQQLDS